MDTRDLRDPQTMGSLFVNTRKVYADKSACWVFDNIIHEFAIPNYPQDESTASITQREYREELLQAAKEGDKYAASRLTTLSGE
jgi:hypothetical protein